METFWEMPENTADMGTVAWGKRPGQFSNGRLTRSEKLKVLTNLGRMGMLEALDAFRGKLGLINSFGADLEGVQPPETALVRDAFDFADEVQNLDLMRHSWRTYYFGMLIGGYRKLTVDKEILFCAAILHDVGLASGRTSEPRDCCFVVHGAERCQHHLVGQGHDRAKVHRIADAIGLHLNGYVSARRYGAEAHLVSRGAMCDVFGMGQRRIAQKVRKDIFARYPKGKLNDALEIWPGHHLAGTRADFLINLEPSRKKPDGLKARPQPGE
ncbi:HD domain-containing protein [uncultured Roseibium sp.]|uniref:HD domain-containing protein n=1 Tax=uncultured Roseibium sp. TaxID=1936171 RepID=UPI00262E3BF8|nr:HD domain-containing protein [uncultured Roseibium sp.]